MPGTTQTQWWSQLIGESRSPTRAAVSRPSIACPARSSWAATSRPTTVTITTRTTQGTVPASMDPASRVAIARIDWLPVQPTNPVRPSWMNRPLNHQSFESRGRIRKPSATVNTKLPVVTAAAHHFLVSSRYGMKTSGVSLIRPRARWRCPSTDGCRAGAGPR